MYNHDISKILGQGHEEERIAAKCTRCRLVGLAQLGNWSAWTSWAKWLVSMLYSSMTLKLHDEDFILNLR